MRTLTLLVLPLLLLGAGPLPRTIDIPQIDLADDADSIIVVDREAGQYLGHPTAALLEDGRTLIAVYPKGHGRGPILMKKSTDGGRTWSDRLPTPDNWSTSKETPTIHRVVDPRTGDRRLILFSGLHPIRIAASDDDGATWTALEPVGDFGGIVAMSSVVTLKDGRLLALFHDDGRFFRAGGAAGPFTLYQIESADGGRTWSEPEAIFTSSEAHLCEPGVIRSPDGGRLVMLLRENSRRRNSHLMISDDEGATWSEPRELPAALTGDRHVGRYLADGRLFISFRDTAHESPTKGDWVAWVGTFDDIIEGRSGAYRVRLMDNHHRWDCAYPVVEVLPDGTIFTMTYGHWTPGESPWIAARRLRVETLDEMVDDLADQSR